MLILLLLFTRLVTCFDSLPPLLNNLFLSLFVDLLLSSELDNVKQNIIKTVDIATILELLHIVRVYFLFIVHRSESTSDRRQTSNEILSLQDISWFGH